MPDAAIKQLAAATDVNALAQRLAGLAADTKLILVDSVHRADGQWGRTVAFADAVNGVAAAFVGMGRHEPAPLQQTLLLAALYREISAALANAGYLSEREVPYHPQSIKNMVSC